MFDDPYKTRRTLELYGLSQYEITKAVKMADGDRLITVKDNEAPENSPTTYVQSYIPTIPDDEIRSFLMRQMTMIQGEWYDEE
ncbi:hypothetical protein [Halobacillus seohaensis]|uniref:Uncharacterized protein n=1 Tax=Halobacillus seohaensis TaxID=447421 RepID=A0ABW2ERR3_9BACI